MTKTSWFFFICFIAMLLSGCGASPSSSKGVSELPDVGAPTNDGSTGNGVVAPIVGVTPAPTPLPVPTPAPPANLTCYDNAGVFCTGANLSGAIRQLDITAMFTGGNPQLQVVVTSVQNNVSADAHQVCAQQFGAGCYQHSVCVNTTIINAGAHVSWPYTWCGNAVNTGNNVLFDQ